MLKSLFNFFTQTSKRLIWMIGLTAFMAIFVVACILVSLPYLIEKPVVRQQFAEQIYKWTGGQFKIQGPIHLEYFPRLRLDAEKVLIKSVRRIPSLNALSAPKASAEFDWLPAFTGRFFPGKLTLHKARLIVSAPGKLDLIQKSTDSSATLLKQNQKIFEVLENNPFNQIELADSNITVFTHNGERSEVNLQQVNAVLESARGSADMSAVGSFVYKQEKMMFDGNFGGVHITPKALSGQLDLTMKNKLGKVALNGRLISLHAKSGQSEIKGQLSANLNSFRHLVRWAGGNLADGRGLTKLVVSGPFQLNQQALELPRAEIEIDGNKASGSLSLSLIEDLPKLEGTLDFDRLNLIPYQQVSAPADRRSIQFVKANTPQPRRLLKTLNMDIRLSTRKMILENLETGEMATSLVANDGVLNMNIVQVDIFGGHMSGRLSANLLDKLPQYKGSFRLNNIDSESLSDYLGYTGLISGKMRSQIRFKTHGILFQKMLKSCSGRIKSEMHAGGTLGIDFNPLLKPGKPSSYFKNMALKPAKTAFQNLAMDMTLKGGKLYKNEITITQTNRKIYLDSKLDLYKKWVEGRIERVTQPTNSTLLKSASAQTPEIVFSGVWPQLFLNGSKYQQ